jgi:hypothetical protein
MNHVPVMMAACALVVTAGCRAASRSAVARKGMIALPRGWVWLQILGADQPGLPSLASPTLKTSSREADPREHVQHLPVAMRAAIARAESHGLEAT